MRKTNLIAGIVIGVLMTGILILIYFMFFYNPYVIKEDRPIKIFVVNSYHDFIWTAETIDSFEKVLIDKGISFELNKFYMNSLMNQTLENKKSKAQEAKKIIFEYKPDLIYVTDDDAQEFVARHFLDTKIPIVFSGVNEEPKKYGYDKAKNVAGVLERFHFIETLDFLKEIYNSPINKIAIIGSTGGQWENALKEIEEDLEAFPDMELINFGIISSYDDYKDKILYSQDKVDVIVHLSIKGFFDEEGVLVSDADVIKWLHENSRIPETGFWEPMVADGMLLSVEVSSIEQGKAAANLAYKILIEGEKPSNLEFKPTTGGVKSINLARAKMFGIEQKDIPSVILINSKVYEAFSWEEE